ncbi:hypothetical protein [Ideonella paludis]|uniref:Uncharacterized protein n=1 Tax=Ideonella paludis TaxID=1233411 RepID=A0ABS5DXS0_9BURK|nr:hypothetical protein [Ideonella paludis]MBQ0935953.1 hypothetical protein [Ideonella paludis]
MKASTITAIAALLSLSCRPSIAVSFSDAAGNLVLFEYAALSAEYCEQRGFPSRSIYSTWQQKHAPLQKESMQRILAEAESRGLPKNEQEHVLSEALANQRKLAS